MTTTHIPTHHFEALTFPAYEITYDRLTNQLSEVFSPFELKEYLNLYERAQKNPKKTRAAVEDLLVKFKNLPEIYNLLGYIYVRLKKIRKAERLIEENYKYNPSNLFSKINYADQCLRKGKSDEIPEIFENVHDLNKLYPNRKTFHFSEVLGFSTLMGFYYLKKGERVKALDYCTYAKMIDPEDFTVKFLIKKLSKKGILTHFLNQFGKRRRCK